MTPTARTLQECRRRGWLAQVVEQTIPKTFIKRDLFGCIDVLALTDIDGDADIVGIQATSAQTGGNHSARVTKILAEPRAKRWLETGLRLEVWSWRKAGARGRRKTWTLRVEPITLAMFEAKEIGA